MNYRYALFLLVLRDIKQQTQNSILGVVWLIIQPLSILLVYTFVFGVILKVRFNADTTTETFAIYLIAGLIPFNAFRESLERGANALIDNRSLLERVIFPATYFPLIVSVSALLTEIISLMLLMGAILWIKGSLSWHCLLLPLLIILRFLLSIGMAWILSILTIFVKDTAQIISLLLTLLFFSTPIIYPLSAVPVKWLWLFKLNPFYYLVDAYRHILIEQQLPNIELAWFALGAIIIALFGFLFFKATLNTAKDLL